MSRPLLNDADRADVFRGLGHPVRRQVIAMLAKRPCSVSELHVGLEMSMAALSQHLAVLRETGLVTERQESARRIYSLRQSGIRKAQKWMRDFK